MLCAKISSVIVLCVVTLCSCNRSSLPSEKEVLGSWSWTYSDGLGRIIFTADHKIKEGFPPKDKDGRTLPDDQFTFPYSGKWRLEGDVLVTEMDNKPFLDMHPENSQKPQLQKSARRLKIIKIDG